jgi:hypothetical protein
MSVLMRTLDTALATAPRHTQLRLPPRRPRRRPLHPPLQKRRPQLLSLPIMQHINISCLWRPKPRVIRQARHARPRTPQLVFVDQVPGCVRHQSLHGPLNRDVRGRPGRSTRWSDMLDAYAQRYAAIGIKSAGVGGIGVASAEEQSGATLVYGHCGWGALAS